MARQRWQFRALAAAAVLAFAMGAAFWMLTLPGTAVSPAIAVMESVEGPNLVFRADQARVESGVIQLRRDLLGELDRRRESLKPETWRAIETSLRELDEAIGEIHLALDEHPDDQRLNHLLATRYRQELDFLRRISRA